MKLSKFDLQVIAYRLGIKISCDMCKSELVAAIKDVIPDIIDEDSDTHDLQTKPDSQSRQAFVISVISVVIALISAAISIASLNYARQQTLVLQRDLEIKEQQVHTEMTAEWEELKRTMQEILISAPVGVDTLIELSRPEKIQWIQRQEDLLNSQTDNPVLIGDEICLGYWRNAIASAQTTKMLLASVESETVDDLFVVSARTIIRDTAFVLNKLILNSDQVSPVGGHPDIDSTTD